MIKIFKYGILLLTLICYMASVMELDSNECKQNFSKEDHACFSTENNCVSIILHSTLYPALLPYQHAITSLQKLSQQSQTYSLLSDPDPPDKLYLRHLVLLI